MALSGPGFVDNIIGGGGGGGGNLLGTAASFLGGPVGGIIGSLLGGLGGNAQLQQGIDQIQGNIAFNPFQGNIGGAGSFGPQGFNPSGALQQGASQLGGLQQQFAGGGFAGNQGFQNALQQGGGINSAVNQANQAFGQQANPFFNQSGFAQNMQNISGLGNIFAQNAAAGPQDLSGGAQGSLFQQGLGNLQQAGNVGGLIDQNLASSRALAQPGEQNLVNQFANREFSATRGATTGAANRQFGLQNSLALADQQRVLSAQQFGQSEAQRLGQLGLGQIGQGSGLLGQNLQGFGQQGQLANQFAQLGLQGEGQGFGQNLQSLGFNSQQGQGRVQQALGLLGFGQNALEGSAGASSGLFNSQLGLGELGVQGQTGFLNAEANRIGATGLSNQAIAQLSADQGGLLGGLF
jgi:hypothetical protein